MKAMIFAAGLGTRLKPLTDRKPKALVEIAGKPLIFYALKKLEKAGFTGVIVNIHHFGFQIVDYLKTVDIQMDIDISDETEMLLDTGGGLKFASWFFNEHKPFLVYNVDVISDINLNEFYNYHIENKAIATLAVSNRQTSRYFLFNQKNELAGWKNKSTGEVKISKQGSENYNEMAFSGIHIINPEIFGFINQTGKFSMTDVYLELAKTQIIKGFDHSGGFWMDLGKPEEIAKAEKVIGERELLGY